MPPVFESIAEAVGGTPLIRLRGLGHGITAAVYAKAEFFSVGGSVKDRAALAMIEAAERDGTLRPGGTIVEATSGNTGIGLAIVGRQRGYQVKIVVSDRSAQEKTDILRAYGAEVIIGSSALPRQHPDHLFSVARRLADDTPGGWLANQYDNPANPLAHARTTGPEIWQQTEGRITHFIAGVGTGGTISGVGRYLKEISAGRVRVIGADPENSTYSGGDGSPYYVESIGHFLHPETDEDVWPESFHADVVDWFERVSDRESLETVRRLAREDGLLAGPSSGTAVAAALRVARELGPSDLVVVLLPDSGRSYLSKVFNDDWMRRWGFLDEPLDGSLTITDVLARGALDDGRDPTDENRAPFVTVDMTATVARALELAGGSGAGAVVTDTTVSTDDRAAALVVASRPSRPYGVSATEVIGSFSVARLTADLTTGRVLGDDPISGYADPPPPTIGAGQSVHDALEAFGPAGTGPDTVIVLRDGRAHAVLTRAALLSAAQIDPGEEMTPTPLSPCQAVTEAPLASGATQPVPNLVGMSAHRAHDAAQAVGFNVSTVPTASRGVPPGIVFAQEPAPGSSARPGSSMIIYAAPTS
jgi:cystathionine beta-synthase